VGASANVTTIGLTERGGVRITFPDFMRFGAPVAAMTLVIGSVFLSGYVFLGDRLVFLLGLGLAAVIFAGRLVLRR
jgi:hypothetical protein